MTLIPESIAILVHVCTFLSLQIATDLNLVNFLVESKDKSKQATVLSVFGSEEELDHIKGRLPPY